MIPVLKNKSTVQLETRNVTTTQNRSISKVSQNEKSETKEEKIVNKDLETYVQVNVRDIGFENPAVK